LGLAWLNHLQFAVRLKSNPELIRILSTNGSDPTPALDEATQQSITKNIQTSKQPTIMKFIVWSISASNIYFGVYNFLNAIGFLNATKYFKASKIVFAILFLSMGINSKQKSQTCNPNRDWSVDFIFSVFIFFNFDK